MDLKATATRVDDDIRPSFNWVHGEESDVLILMLSGFRREELKVQITSTRILKVSGEQEKEDNKLRQRRRFHEEFSVPGDIDTKHISAKFEGGKLHIKLPKVITHEEDASQEGPQKPRKAEPEAEAKEVSQKKQEKENEEEAIVGLLVKLKKYTKLSSLLVIVATFLVLVIGIYVRNHVLEGSSLEGSKIQEL